MHKFVHIIILIWSFQSLFAQDPVLTQFYAVPVLMNPAFAGSEGNFRLGLGYRDQATKSNYKLKTVYAFGDNWVESINSGIGLSFLNQKEELTNYNFIQINLHYSYHLKLSENWTFFPGIAFGIGYKDFRFGGLLFEDQIDLAGGNDPVTSDPIYDHIAENVFFMDLAVGGILYAENAWFGFSLKHLTTPDISFVENEILPLAMHMSLHGGYQISLSNRGRNSFFPEDSNLFLTFNYMKQDIYNRIDFGAEMEISKFSFGFLSSSVIQKIDSNAEFLLSISPVIGLETNNFKVGFSYDFPISNFSTIGGTSEIALQYFINNNYTRRSRWQRKH